MQRSTDNSAYKIIWSYDVPQPQDDSVAKEDSSLTFCQHSGNLVIPFKAVECSIARIWSGS